MAISTASKAGGSTEQGQSLIRKFDDGKRGPSPEYVEQEGRLLRGTPQERENYMQALEQTRRAGVQPAGKDAPREEFDARAATIMAVNARLQEQGY